ncbi:SDR family NAD(P)-dependent oxidoreductase [Octadecabacter sp. SW4]|uniref:SDR family oxidoreductase n=1 Tax=Octadecabacter sp. SW4 TaxID=2602067 RepID=UPI0011C1D674|nr:SDR family NAD(P)-dependent oxidoreductase [Octadecabacter sp. SW4]QEE34899.1 SDR family NAD(P)-dependent oxidoreductase [Octadecabacter sp. SW4]
MFDLSPIEIPDLSGKTILITGAGRGIGAVLAGKIAASGGKVYAGILNAPDPAWADHLKDCTLVDLDVTDAGTIATVLTRIKSENGRLDALVNNAGSIAPIGHIDTLATESLRQAYEINALGVHRMTCAALPLLRASKGVVVNAGTGAATTPMEGWTAYCNSKAAARMMTMMFAKDLDGGDVQFFFVGIPPTDTEMQSEIRTAGLNPISKIAKKDLVHPDVPASVMAWLCGPQARKLDEVLLDVREEPFKSMMG